MEVESGKNMTKLCQICEQNASKYLCPRCGAPYCSLTCYKDVSKHLQCSESFYRDCVVEHVRSEEVRNPESAKKMQEVLQRFHNQYNNEEEDLLQDDEEEELDSDDDAPLDQRLAEIDLNDSEEVWKHLTEDERKEFQNLVKNFDEAGDIIPEWVPWWYDEPEKKLVVDVSDNRKSEVAAENPLRLSKRQPEIRKQIPKMIELTKIKPNEHVAKGMINVVAAYVWTARLYNGDIMDSEKLIEIASSIICLSSYLNKSSLFKNIEHAVADVPMNACKVSALSEGGGAIQTSLNRDVWILIKGPDKVVPSVAKGYLLSALTQCHSIFAKSLKLLKSKSQSPDSSKRPKQKSGTEENFSSLFPSSPPVVSADVALLNNSKRRLLYLLAFANEYIEDFKGLYATRDCVA